MGIEAYGSETPGLGGRLRVQASDFAVEEIIDSQRMQSVTHGSYLLCRLIKVEWDNLLALKRIAETLHININRISIAGIKDKRAKTVQLITIKGVTPADIRAVAVPHIALTPIGFVAKPISSAHLIGNRFEVTVRSIESQIQVVYAMLYSVEEKLAELGGFPNFYGHQRFGTYRPVTHKVGRHIIRGDLERAALTFLTEECSAGSLLEQQARADLAASLDYKRALEQFPSYLIYERAMLRRLAEKPSDYPGAFRQLPLRLRRLFVHAYQSFFFNKILSMRLLGEMLFTKVETGEFIAQLERDAALRIGKVFRVTEGDRQLAGIKIKCGAMALALPVFGYRTKLSGGMQGEAEVDMLEEEGISLSSFRVEHLQEVSAAGGFRLALLPGLKVDASIGEDELFLGKRKLSFAFSLPKGSYATVVLREYLKPEDPLAAGF